MSQLENPDTIVFLVLGLVLLMAGRQAYKFTVGIIGFVGGWYLAMALVPGLEGWQRYAAALLCGVGGIIAARVATVAAWVIGGFFAGGFAVYQAAAHLGVISSLGSGQGSGAYFIGGGIAGAFLMFFLMDWGIIIGSSLLGAYLIVDNTMSDGWGAYAVFVILAAGGAFNQYRILREKKKK